MHQNLILTGCCKQTPVCVIRSHLVPALIWICFFINYSCVLKFFSFHEIMQLPWNARSQWSSHSPEERSGIAWLRSVWIHFVTSWLASPLERCECCFPAVPVCLFVLPLFWNSQTWVLFRNFKKYLEDLPRMKKLWSLYVFMKEDITESSK